MPYVIDRSGARIELAQHEVSAAISIGWALDPSQERDDMDPADIVNRYRIMRPEPSGQTIRVRGNGTVHVIDGTFAQAFVSAGIRPSYREQICRGCDKKCIEGSGHEEFWHIDGTMLCNACFLKYSWPCQRCKEIHLDGRSIGSYFIDSREGVVNRKKPKQVCNDCWEAMTIECVGCSNRYMTDDPNILRGANGYCVHCIERLDSGRVPVRRFKINKDAPINEGAIVKSVRKFGVELETQFPNGRAMAAAAMSMPSDVGIGTDGSINGNGVEIRFPPLIGKYGEEVVEKTCKELIKAGFTVDKSCGYHVHIDTSDIDNAGDNGVNMAKTVWAFYMTFEDVLLSFLPNSRKSGAHALRYCQSLKADYHLDEILRVNSMSALERLWYRLSNNEQVDRAKRESHHPSRYRGINLHPMITQRHLEIRYHGGTIRAKKVLEWANLHCRLVDKLFMLGGIESGYLRHWCAETNIELKTQELFNVLDLSEESRGYFLARQQEYYVAPKFAGASESGKSLLKEEKEQ